MLDVIKYATYTLVLIGALNWGLVGVFEFNLVEYLFGDMTMIARTIYILVGLSAIISPIICYIKYKNDEM